MTAAFLVGVVVGAAVTLGLLALWALLAMAAECERVRVDE